MEIKSGVLYENRTWKYLYTCIKEYDSELINHLATCFKLGVGIGDANFKSTEEDCLYILIDTKVLVVNPREAQEYQDRFASFLDWLSHRFYYVADYPYSMDKHMIVIKIPNKHQVSLEAFKRGLYSEMYSNRDINEYFKPCIIANKTIEKERNETIANTKDILTRNVKYIPTFVALVNSRYKTDATIEDFLEAELDFPIDLSQEIFNYEQEEKEEK